MAGFLGMTGTGRWSNEERPKRFREGLLLLFPNGDMPITAISSKGRSRKVDDPEFKWFSKNLETQGGAVTATYHDAALSDDWSSAESGSVGDLVYAKVTAAIVSHFRPGHIALLIDADDDTKKSFGKVESVSANGASSYVAVRLRTTSATGYLNACDYIDIIGSAHEEGANIPQAISYDPAKFNNYTQIFRTPLDITRTQRLTRMRTGDQYKEQKREALLYHGTELEMATIFGEKTEVTGDNGHKERTTQGMVSFINENISDNIVDHRDEALTWLQGGEAWLDEKLEQLFRFGRDRKLAVCGSGALLGIMKLVKQGGDFQLTATTGAYGVKVVRWVTPFGEIMLKRHPLFTYKSYQRNTMLLFEPENIQFSYISDTHFKADDGQNRAGYLGYDGTKEEYLTEAGYEFHFPETMMYMTGVGQDGTG